MIGLENIGQGFTGECNSAKTCRFCCFVLPVEFSEFLQAELAISHFQTDTSGQQFPPLKSMDISANRGNTQNIQEIKNAGQHRHAASTVLSAQAFNQASLRIIAHATVNRHAQTHPAWAWTALPPAPETAGGFVIFFRKPG